MKRASRDPLSITPLRRSALAWRSRPRGGFPYGMLAAILITFAIGVGIAM